MKVKTKYFFKWCKFLEERNFIKKMKNKEIEDLKKAKLFHKYSLKFQTFIEWKQYIRRVKNTRQRALVLEEKTKKSILVNIIDKIKEKT